jgi:hypothetical protein
MRKSAVISSKHTLQWRGMQGIAQQYLAQAAAGRMANM